MNSQKRKRCKNVIPIKYARRHVSIVNHVHINHKLALIFAKDT